MQKYHINAKTNNHIRSEIQRRKLNQKELSERLNINRKTVHKWQARNFVEDKSSRPKTIHYALSERQKEIVRIIRKLTWWSKEDIAESLADSIERINPSNVYRTLKNFGINTIPEERKKEAKRFKEYEPGFIHIDVTYLPKMEGKKHYLFVAIDRATRLVYYEIHETKEAKKAKSFLLSCEKFFPFALNKMLTDNGTEFTAKQFRELCDALGIEHRRTKPYTPKTNGMVEKANDIIKSATVRTTKYSNSTEMKQDLLKFLKFYNLARSHGGLRREIKRRTPFHALLYWYDLKPQLFHLSPQQFKANLLSITL